MADSTVNGNTGLALASFEKELVCSICTEILYQPLTILNCLHTFCGSCLKEWFSHQHRKASTSRSAPSSANPYSCPTCRAEVRDVHHNATVSNLLELFLAANPSRQRTQEEKDDMDQIYKPDGTRPGDKILPRVDRRREKRSRREDDAATRERQMIEDARERSLQDLNAGSSTNSLSPPEANRTRSTSRDREDRRQRRRERERQRDNSTTLSAPSSTPSRPDRNDTVSPPVSSPRHPSAVEARQREHRMSHQASLRSLVSASDGGTGSSDVFDEARIMQEIIDEGLLGDIDIDSLTEAEQDSLAERIAELYRQRHPSRQSTSSPPQSSHQPSIASSDQLRVRGDQRSVDSSAQPAAVRDTSQPTRPQRPPPSSLARSNSQNSSVTINHRRRTSDQARAGRADDGSRASSVDGPITSGTVQQTLSQPNQTVSLGRSSSTNTPRHRSGSRNPRTASETLLQAGGADSSTISHDEPPPPRSPRHTQTMPISPPAQIRVAELDGGSTLTNAIPALTQYQEPSVTCFRCGEPDLQYDISKHCHSCNVDLCMSCYRLGKGCKHWFGFGHAAEVNFENSKTRDDSSPPPHALIGRRYQRPVASAIITTRPAHLRPEELPIKTTSNPLDRLQEGHFCDRCASFANNQFWLCDVCNDGEWGFCKDCVDTHHCCAHPLLPVAYHPQQMSNALANLHLYSAQSTLQPTAPPTARVTTGTASGSSSRPETPNSVISNRSHREAGYDYLSINVNCDNCHQIILPADLRYHCPFHSSDFDICTSCYNSFIVHTRTRRDGTNTAEAMIGWRKCPQGHRMVAVVFEADVSDDGDGGMRRVIKHDLVGGWKMSDTEIRAWNSQHNLYATPPTSPPLAFRGTWSWKEDATGARRGTRSRSSTLTNSNSGLATATNMKFPPDGGFGKRGQAFYAYWPEEGEDGAGELKIPRGAEVSEIEDVNGDWWSGVYAGDIGIFPFGYVREYK